MARKARSIRTARLAMVHGVHPIPIPQWKKQLMAGRRCFAFGAKVCDKPGVTRRGLVRADRPAGHRCGFVDCENVTLVLRHTFNFG